MPSDAIPWIGLGVGAAGLGLSIFNTIRQSRHDRKREAARLVISCALTFRDDNEHPFAMSVRITNAAFRPAQVVKVGFLIDPEVFRFGTRSMMTLVQLEPVQPLPAEIGENRSITLQYDPASFAVGRGLTRVEVEDALGNRFYGDVPQVDQD